MNTKQTRDQDKNNNPTGKGGFGDHPEHRNSGTWDSKNSQSYCINMFLNMTDDEFIQWEKDNPSSKRTVAQVLAREYVIKARKDLSSYREITNRAEGMPKLSIDNTGEIRHQVIVYKPEKNKF